MLVELLSGERELLSIMHEGKPVPASVVRLALAVKRKRLLVGVAFPLSNVDLALISIVGGGLDLATGPIDAPDGNVPEREDHGVIPVEVDESDVSSIEDRYKSNGHSDSYDGARIKWPKHEFKSTPRTPISKLEKGRPITYLSPKDGTRRGGRFVRISPRDKSMALVASGEMKKAFPVPTKDVVVTDLSPPSTEPLPVQI